MRMGLEPHAREAPREKGWGSLGVSLANCSSTTDH